MRNAGVAARATAVIIDGFLTLIVVGPLVAIADRSAAHR